jgi:hypothetical protein
MRKVTFLAFVILSKSLCFGQSFNLKTLIEIPKRNENEISLFLSTKNYNRLIDNKYITNSDTLRYWNDSKQIIPLICKLIFPNGIEDKSNYEIDIQLEDSLLFTKMLQKEVKEIGFKIDNYFKFDNSGGVSLDLYTVKSTVTGIVYKRGTERIVFFIEEKVNMTPMISLPENCRYEKLSFNYYYTINYQTRK